MTEWVQSQPDRVRGKPVGRKENSACPGRRDRGLQVPRPCQAASRARRCRNPGDDARRAGVRYAARGRRPLGRPRLYRPLLPGGRTGRRPYPSRPRPRPRPGGAGNGGPDGEDGERSCRRSRFRCVAGDASAGSAGARNESGHVGSPRDAAQLRDALGRRRALRRTGDRRDGRKRRGRQRPHERTSRDRRRRRASSRPGGTASCRKEGDRHFRPDARTDRSGSLYRQSLFGSAGTRHSRRPRGTRSRRAPRFRSRRDSRSARGLHDPCRARRGNARCGSFPAAGRYRRHGRGGSRLAGLGGGRHEDQEKRGRGGPGTRSGREPRHTEVNRPPCRAPCARRRLRRGDGERRRQRPPQARSQGCRHDRRQRRLKRARRHGRRAKPRAPGDARGRGGLAGNEQGRGRGASRAGDRGASWEFASWRPRAFVPALRRRARTA